MKTVYNISRRVARQNGRAIENSVWISISEPGDDSTIASNQYLDKLPKLKVSFYDTDNPNMIDAPNAKIAKQIVEFLLKHTDKDVIINCAMGIARSGAISQFCQDFLNYEWDRTSKNQAIPNRYLYRLMANYYYETYYGKEDESKSSTIIIL